MRLLLSIFPLLICQVILGQTLTDIATTEGITFTQHSAINLGNGMSFYDFDEDGWDDLSFPSNVDSIFLYRNIGGTYSKILPSIHAPGDIRQITWLDYDNDGDLDIFVSFHHGVRMYNNDGNFQFSDVTIAAGFDPSTFEAFGVSVADPDADGDLDIYVCVYWLPTSLNPIPNQYYENQGNGTFIEKAAMLNIDNGLGSSFQSIWFDMNNDNQLDLHVINDRHIFQDEMYVNDGTNNYLPSATSMGIDNWGHFPMGVSVGDYNNDGYQDVFKSDAANGTFFNGLPLDYKLFRNNNGTSFSDVAPWFGLNHPAFAWGGLWIDYNNDSYEDLFVSTGFTDTINNTALPSVFFQNNQGTTFHNVTDSLQGDIIRTSYSAVKGDIDRDGFYDMVVLNDGAPPNIFKNDGNENKYVRITVVGTESNRMAIGSTIKVYANNTSQTQMIFCGSGLCAQNSQHKNFGIGSASFVDSIVVTFPNGNVAKRYNVPADAEYVIPEKTIVQVPLTTGAIYNHFCEGDTLTIGVGGLYNYQWSTGQTSSHITVDTTGIYSFTAQNALGDTLYESSDLSVFFHNQIPHQTVVVDALCGANSYGSAEVIPTNLSIVDSVVWSNGTNGLNISNVIPGMYEYIVHSIYGCTDSGSVHIAIQTPFTSQYVTTPCTDQQGGTVQFYTWGGNPPFTYSFNAAVVSDYIENLQPGTYEVVITDDAGCTDTVDFIIPNHTTTGISIVEDVEVHISYSNEQLSICGIPSEAPYTVEIINGLGQRVAHWIHSNATECQSSFLKLTTGGYIVVLTTNQQTYIQRLSID